MVVFERKIETASISGFFITYEAPPGSGIADMDPPDKRYTIYTKFVNRGPHSFTQGVTFIDKMSMELRKTLVFPFNPLTPDVLPSPNLYVDYVLSQITGTTLKQLSEILKAVTSGDIQTAFQYVLSRDVSVRAYKINKDELQLKIYEAISGIRSGGLRMTKGDLLQTIAGLAGLDIYRKAENSFVLVPSGQLPTAGQTISIRESDILSIGANYNFSLPNTFVTVVYPSGDSTDYPLEIGIAAITGSGNTSAGSVTFFVPATQGESAKINVNGVTVPEPMILDIQEITYFEGLVKQNLGDISTRKKDLQTKGLGIAANVSRNKARTTLMQMATYTVTYLCDTKPELYDKVTVMGVEGRVIESSLIVSKSEPTTCQVTIAVTGDPKTVGHINSSGVYTFPAFKQLVKFT
ncbi:MAG: hypothetical protein P3W91_003115 [Fervidobacterium sp.]|nr:hypothetical protein [Fervidobacterium sp.]